ncbi:MAG: hypothetical protein NTW59_04040 [Candidatus Diapherotrites archaeon]|nr:hypothetical protein [Candidatus Diapherotrites archaeon]
MANLQAIGAWAFMLGVLIAILSGVIAVVVPGVAGYIPLLLVILGLVVGLVNITDKEIQAFLIAGIALLVVGIPNGGLLTQLDVVVNGLGTAFAKMLQAVAVFAAPAVLVVSLKAFYALSKLPPKGK